MGTPSSIRIGRAGPVRATTRVPGSKSITNRALVAAALASGASTLTGASLSDDSVLLVEALRGLGIDTAVESGSSRIRVTGCAGTLPRPRAELSLGNAGSSLRFLTAMLCMGRGSYRIDGTERMRQRPIGDLVDGLEQMGAKVTYLGKPGCPPLQIEASGLVGGALSVAGGTSSQFVSAVLLSAPAAAAPVRLTVAGRLVSAPYVELTLSVMKAFGIEVARTDPSTFEVPRKAYQPRDYAVAGDAASAGYLFALAAATGGAVTVEGLYPSVPQAELGLVGHLQSMGCTVRRNGGSITVEGGALRGVDVDMNDAPDSVQTLAPLALLARGTTRIRNVANLRVKETDRLSALGEELRRFGARVDVAPDGLTIVPPEKLRPAEVRTYDDHRMAMGFAALGAAVGDVVIHDPAVVSKSYPGFFEALAGLGVPLE